MPKAKEQGYYTDKELYEYKGFTIRGNSVEALVMNWKGKAIVNCGNLREAEIFIDGMHAAKENIY